MRIYGLTNTDLAPWKSLLFTKRRLLFPLSFPFTTAFSLLHLPISFNLQVEQVHLWFEKSFDFSQVMLGFSLKIIYDFF